MMNQQLLCIQPKLENIVHQGKERGQRKGRNKNCDESILNHYKLRGYVVQKMPLPTFKRCNS